MIDGAKLRRDEVGRLLHPWQRGLMLGVDVLCCGGTLNHVTTIRGKKPSKVSQTHLIFSHDADRH